MIPLILSDVVLNTLFWRFVMTKKERVVSAINKMDVDYVPCGFSLHFPSCCNSGDAGVKAHVDFFKESEADIYKIMNENLVPTPGKGVHFPEAYKQVKSFDLKTPFIREQVDFTKKILDACDGEGFTMGTLHGICASALHPIEKSGVDYDTARQLQLDSLRADEAVTLDAFKRIADGMCSLVEGYKEAGVDSIYYAALGAEHRYLTAEEFEKWFKPFDLQIMKAIKDNGMYCFLHICKDGLDMDRYAGYGKYADVVNWGVYEAPYSLEDGRKLFEGCTIMGGLKNRSGVLVDGTDEEIKNEVHSVISSFGKKGFILGADCTLATEQDMHKLRTAVEACRS